ncbi:hypothetical protein MES5069_490098 [Mesorhizobium escarrei]|uniref:Uncharacterized protein n=1 Tax=Mesorhizobium escarrei TaxID=666018 RepID=A0ABM9EAF9_9HYPH|nr:hypothetical protein MES5069_490098 [Mesorhizobium escarrei]
MLLPRWVPPLAGLRSLAARELKMRGRAGGTRPRSREEAEGRPPRSLHIDWRTGRNGAPAPALSAPTV